MVLLYIPNSCTRYFINPDENLYRLRRTSQNTCGQIDVERGPRRARRDPHAAATQERATRTTVSRITSSSAMKSTLVAAATTALVATVTGQCTSYMEIQGAINAVQTACPSPSAPLAGQAISLPSTCSATCASAFNSWYMGGQGACFTALNLPPTMISTFQNFGGLCGGGGAVCPQTACPGAAEDRYVLVDQAMSWAQAQSYCRSRYRDLASIHSADEEELARAKCGTSATMNHCVDRFVDSASCTGTAGCWIGLHQAIGQSYSTDEVVVFDNAAQCHVDHRIPENLLDVPLDTSKFSSPLYPILYFGHLTTSLPLGPPPTGWAAAAPP